MSFLWNGTGLSGNGTGRAERSCNFPSFQSSIVSCSWFYETPPEPASEAPFRWILFPQSNDSPPQRFPDVAAIILYKRMAHARLSLVPPYLGSFTLRQTSTRKISGACKLWESWKSGEWRGRVSSGWRGTDLWRFLANDRQSWDLFYLVVHLTEVKALRVGHVSDILMYRMYP